MESLLTSLSVVTLAEIGDKTQLLAIVLATRFQRPAAIIAGILAATIGNHFLAALVGAQAAAFLSADWFHYLVGASFIAMAAWTLVPDKLDDGEQSFGSHGAFLTTLVAFFLVEMGDKTQVATVALAARFHEVLLVTLGTTAGMMLANVPAVFLGHKVIEIVPLRVVHVIAACLFLVIGLLVIAQAAGWLG